MKKLLASLVLGFGLLASGVAVLAQAPAAAPAETAAAAKPAEAASTAPAAAPVAAATPAAAAPAAAASAPPAPVPNKGDTSWMMVSTMLVILMTIPGLALFYGGLVRSKNMLSVLMQIMVWCCGSFTAIAWLLPRAMLSSAVLIASS